MAGKNKQQQQQQQGEISKGRKMLNSLWVVLVVVSFVTLVGTLFGQMNELSAVQWGQSFVADYYEEGSFAYAEYTDANGVMHKFNLTGHSPVHDGDKVTMYYISDIDEATPQNTVTSFLGYYIVFGALFMLSMWKLRSIVDSAPRRN